MAYDVMSVRVVYLVHCIVHDSTCYRALLPNAAHTMADDQSGSCSRWHMNRVAVELVEQEMGHAKALGKKEQWLLEKMRTSDQKLKPNVQAFSEHGFHHCRSEAHNIHRCDFPTLGCPVGPPPPSHQTTRLFAAAGGTLSINVMAKLGFTCFGVSINRTFL
ncbi:hypothetical protein B566_EDAN002914 [Ephemera danica]|nr:hypothetical protein B566_EDAN002914 [Ephemera danica]